MEIEILTSASDMPLPLIGFSFIISAACRAYRDKALRVTFPNDAFSVKSSAFRHTFHRDSPLTASNVQDLDSPPILSQICPTLGHKAWRAT